MGASQLLLHPVVGEAVLAVLGLLTGATHDVPALPGGVVLPAGLDHLVLGRRAVGRHPPPEGGEPVGVVGGQAPVGDQLGSLEVEPLHAGGCGPR